MKTGPISIAGRAGFWDFSGGTSESQVGGRKHMQELGQLVKDYPVPGFLRGVMQQMLLPAGVLAVLGIGFAFTVGFEKVMDKSSIIIFGIVLVCVCLSGLIVYSVLSPLGVALYENGCRFSNGIIVLKSQVAGIRKTVVSGSDHPAEIQIETHDGKKLILSSTRIWSSDLGIIARYMLGEIVASDVEGKKYATSHYPKFPDSEQ